ncbi:MAG: YiiD C-terminal domain-containing protein [Steroidobacteraceae bacterium]
MDARELEAYLHDRIPLSRAMAVAVVEAGSERVRLSAPLSPNINHRDTVFGGSAASLATLAAWSLIHVRLRLEGLSGRIVIRRGTTSYDRPMADEFTATALAPAADEWAKLKAALQRGRPGRLHASATLECRGAKAGTMDGEFVVLPPERADS